MAREGKIALPVGNELLTEARLEHLIFASG
jgi:hypothetical protein